MYGLEGILPIIHIYIMVHNKRHYDREYDGFDEYLEDPEFDDFGPQNMMKFDDFGPPNDHLRGYVTHYPYIHNGT